VITTFCKKIGESLVTFYFSHQIIKHNKISVTNVDVLKVIWITLNKFYPGNCTLKFIVQSLPLSERPNEYFDSLGKGPESYDVSFEKILKKEISCIMDDFRVFHQKCVGSTAHTTS
jgi:hypothetical protein